MTDAGTRGGANHVAELFVAPPEGPSAAISCLEVGVTP